MLKGVKKPKYVLSSKTIDNINMYPVPNIAINKHINISCFK
jgi:hypothetical protein